jgi:sarcosine oxidase subunit beta
MAAMQRYWGGALLRESLRGHKGWRQALPDTRLSGHYDAVIIGGGGHGLATAYYLAKRHGLKRVAVIEKGWLGGGNTGRNTTVIRSNYLYPESAALYDLSLKLYEGLSRELNYNIMLSQRGLITLAHTPHDMESIAYWASAMRCNGVDSELLTAQQVQEAVPLLAAPQGARFPVLGGLIQPRGGIARHDAVAWGYARAAAALGVEVVQGCEVTDFDVRNGRLVGLSTTQGELTCDKAAIVAASGSIDLAARVGLELPMNIFTLQAFVSEPTKPVLDRVVLSLATGVYFSQSDKGELVIGGAIDHYTSYNQRGGFMTAEAVLGALVDMYPRVARMKLLRNWGGAVDVVHDSSPLIGLTPISGLYLNCGWGTGGFKAIPAGGYCLAATMAKDAPHPLIAAFGLNRFQTGAMVDEAAASGIAH